MCKSLVVMKYSRIFKNKSFTSLIDLLSLELILICNYSLIQEIQFINFLLFKYT